jgi:hypothetical protein
MDVGKGLLRRGFERRLGSIDEVKDGTVHAERERFAGSSTVSNPNCYLDESCSD